MFTISAMKGDLEDKHAELVIQAAKPLYLHQFGQFRWIPKHTNKGSLQSAMYKLQDKFAWAQLHIVKLKDRPSLPCKTVTYGISWKESKTHEKKKWRKQKCTKTLRTYKWLVSYNNQAKKYRTLQCRCIVGQQYGLSNKHFFTITFSSKISSKLSPLDNGAKKQKHVCTGPVETVQLWMHPYFSEGKRCILWSHPAHRSEAYA